MIRRVFLLLFLGACSSGYEGSFSLADWEMPALGANRPVVWIIETPDEISAGAAALGMPVTTRAYARFGSLFTGLRRCEIHTPPLNSAYVMVLLRHEVAHCEVGRFHD